MTGFQAGCLFVYDIFNNCYLSSSVFFTTNCYKVMFVGLGITFVFDGNRLLESKSENYDEFKQVCKIPVIDCCFQGNFVRQGFCVYFKVGPIYKFDLQTKILTKIRN